MLNQFIVVRRGRSFVSGFFCKFLMRTEPSRHSCDVLISSEKNGTRMGKYRCGNSQILETIIYDYVRRECIVAFM